MKLFRSIIASFTALALLVSTAGVRPVVAGQDPNGQILELNEEYVQGWAYDADYKGLPSEVHIYIDGSLYKNTIADIPLQSLVDLGLTPSADHSFIVRFQDYTLVSGNTYEIRAYALDNSTRAKVELSGSPMSLTITGGGNDNSTPKAKINVKSSRFETGDPLAFDATSSTTTDHQTFNPGPPPNLTFQWTLVPPVGATVTLSSTTLPTVFFTPAVPGDYTVSLTVTDPVNSATHEATQTVTVVSPGVTAIQPSIISFVDIADAEPDTFYTSNTNVLSGFIHPVSVTAVGGRGTSIVKNGYNTGSTSVMVATGDIVALRSQSSSLPGSEETVTFTIGPTTVTWTIYTAQNPVHAPCTLGTQSWDVPGEHMFTDTSHCEYLLFEVWGAGKNGRYESQSIQKSTNNEYILHVGDLQGVLDTRVTQNDPLTGKAVTVLKAEGRIDTNSSNNANGLITVTWGDSPLSSANGTKPSQYQNLPGIAYHHSDHLGSGSVDTDENGNIVELIDYYPFGTPRLNENPGDYENDYKFTGKELDEDTGLYYYGARYYDANLSRFTAIDPVALKGPSKVLEDPQQLNMYAYARNNPLKYVDPTGEWAVPFARGALSVISGVLGYGSSVIVPPAYAPDVGEDYGAESSYSPSVAEAVTQEFVNFSGQHGYEQAALYAVTAYKVYDTVNVAKNAGDLINLGGKGISRLQLPKGFSLSRHAVDQMNLRKISKTDVSNTILNGEKFDFVHKGTTSIQKGFYDSSTKVFVPVSERGVIPTVFKRPQSQIQKLKDSMSNINPTE